MANTVLVRQYDRYTGVLKHEFLLDDFKRLLVRGDVNYDSEVGNIYYNFAFADEDAIDRHWEFDDLEIILDPDVKPGEVGTDVYLL